MLYYLFQYLNEMDVPGSGVFESVYLNLVSHHWEPVSNAFEIYIGQTIGMHFSASGKSLLSMHSEEFRKNYFALDTVADTLSNDGKKEVLEEIDRAARLGYSVSNGDFDGRISTLAAPVMNLRNEPVATISIAIKSAEFDPPEARQYSKNLVQAARQLSARII